MDANAKPFTVERRRGILYATLSTPGSDVNIFGNPAADQLREILRGVGGDTRAVVLQSAKPDSFVNGVGLLMAMAVKTTDAGGALSSTVRAAYHAIRDCPVPTIAAIEGNCYGCGVELSLCCDYRVATDTASTHFYMTEVNDYLFLPVFEGTLRLPLLLGLEGAADLLLWRQRWSAQQAWQRGLVDAVFERERFARDTESFVEEVWRVNGGKPPPRPPADAGVDAGARAATVDAIRARIRRLPPQVQDLYEQCLDLMVRGVTAGRVTTADAALEIERSSASSCDPKAKKALSFFFIRQAAHQRCLGQAATPAPRVHLTFAGTSPALLDWQSTLAARRLAGVEVHALGETAAGDDERQVLHFVDYTERAAGEPGRAHAFAVALRSGAGLRWPARTVLYAPFRGEPPLLEIAVRDAILPADRLAYQVLARAGYRAVLSRPQQKLVLEQAVVAYLAPLVRYLLEGGSAAVVDESLRRFGFIRRASQLVHQLEREPLVGWLAQALPATPARAREAIELIEASGSARTAGGAREDPALAPAVCVSLFVASQRWREQGALSHAGLVDVVARDALDFPLQYGSLLSYLSPERVRELTVGAASFARYLLDDELAVLEDAAERGRGAYL